MNLTTFDDYFFLLFLVFVKSATIYSISQFFSFFIVFGDTSTIALFTIRIEIKFMYVCMYVCNPGAETGETSSLSRTVYQCYLAIDLFLQINFVIYYMLSLLFVAILKI